MRATLLTQRSRPGTGSCAHWGDCQVVHREAWAGPACKGCSLHNSAGRGWQHGRTQESFRNTQPSCQNPDVVSCQESWLRSWFFPYYPPDVCSRDTGPPPALVLWLWPRPAAQGATRRALRAGNFPEKRPCWPRAPAESALSAVNVCLPCKFLGADFLPVDL